MKVLIDFIGMCLVIRDYGRREGRLTIGFLHDPTHIHMLLFVGQDGGSRGVLLRSQHFLAGCIEAQTTTVENLQRLPDLAMLAGEQGNRGRVEAALGASIKLPHGRFEALVPTLLLAEGPWTFGGTTHCLTDRCTFDSLTNEAFVTVGEHHLYPRGDVISAAMVAIDHDISTRVTLPRRGLKLEEFQMFYRCTERSGPIPIFSRPDAADPGNPICPDARIDLISG